jgi:WD repeat-containing protein 48
MSLATLRTHVWKGGSDIVLHYKSNGRKEIRPFKPPAPELPAEADPVAEDATTAQPPATAPEAAGTAAAPVS